MDVQARPIAPSLLALLPLYGGLAVLSGFLGNKQIDLGPFAMELGLFAYVGVVAISSCVAELHGQALANRLVLWGFVPVLASMVLIAAALALPYSVRMAPERIAGYEVIFGQSPRIMVAGIVAYFVSVFLNVRIFGWLGTRGFGGPMRRGAIASACAQMVDGLIFVTIGFLGVFPILPILAGQLLAKLALSFTLVPLLIRIGLAMGRRLDEE